MYTSCITEGVINPTGRSLLAIAKPDIIISLSNLLLILLDYQLVLIVSLFQDTRLLNVIIPKAKHSHYTVLDFYI